MHNDLRFREFYFILNQCVHNFSIDVVDMGLRNHLCTGVQSYVSESNYISPGWEIKKGNIGKIQRLSRYVQHWENGSKETEREKERERGQRNSLYC